MQYLVLHFRSARYISRIFKTTAEIKRMTDERSLKKMKNSAIPTSVLNSEKTRETDAIISNTSREYLSFNVQL